MSFMTILDIFFRWLHVIAACLAIGGAFFLRVIVPRGIDPLDAEQREAAFLRIRRGFKLVVHPAILALIVSGIYNTLKNWPWYLADARVMHAFFGLHLLLALAVIAISLYLLAGREPKRGHKTWMKVNVVLMLLTVAAASSLKWARDYRMAEQAGSPVKVLR